MKKTYRWHIKNKIKTYYSECYHAGQIFRVVVPDNFDFGGNGCMDVSYEHFDFTTATYAWECLI